MFILFLKVFGVIGFIKWFLFFKFDGIFNENIWLMIFAVYTRCFFFVRWGKFFVFAVDL